MGQRIASAASEISVAPPYSRLHRGVRHLFCDSVSFFQVGVLPPPVFLSDLLRARYVVYDNSGNVKPVKGACFSIAEMQENVCVFAAGQGAYGLIAVGQAAVGLIVIAQGGVGKRRSVRVLYPSHTRDSNLSAFCDLSLFCQVSSSP